MRTKVLLMVTIASLLAVAVALAACQPAAEPTEAPPAEEVVAAETPAPDEEEVATEAPAWNVQWTASSPGLR